MIAFINVEIKIEFYSLVLDCITYPRINMATIPIFIDEFKREFLEWQVGPEDQSAINEFSKELEGGGGAIVRREVGIREI